MSNPSKAPSPIPIHATPREQAPVADSQHLPARRQTGTLDFPHQLVRTPLIDIFDTGNGLLLQADVPGTSEKGLTIHLEHNVLSLRALVENTLPPDARPLDQEYLPAHFERSFILSDEIDRAGITAELRDGVLSIWMPHADKSLTRLIEIRTE